MKKDQHKKSIYLKDMRQIQNSLDSLRKDPQGFSDVTLAEYVNARFGITIESFFEDLGVNPAEDTISNLFTMPTEGYKWLVPEVVREALRLGLRKTPIYPSVIAGEQQTNSTHVKMPSINMSDATPKRVRENESIPLGTISYGQKEFDLYKFGRGIQISYEVRQYVALSVVAIYLQDLGVKMGHGLDALLIDTLLNGEQTDGSESAPVIGTISGTSLVYKDLLRVWVRMSRLGKSPSVMIGGEEIALDILDLDEFKTKHVGTPMKNISLKTPVPNSSDFFIHGSMPDDQVLVVDPSSTALKYNAQPLLVESEKIISTQSEATYASFTTGFGIVYRDSRIVVDRSIAYAGHAFPTYMDVDALEQVSMD